MLQFENISEIYTPFLLSLGVVRIYYKDKIIYKSKLN